MGPSCIRTIVFVLAVVSAAPLHAQDQVTVDAGAIVADVSRRPIGINLNFLLDDDANRADAVRTLAQALKQAGVKYLRYPGGEKADAYLWSVPPYSSSIPTLARWATGEWPENGEWPSYDRSLVKSDGRTFKTDPLSFDEFMAICREIDCIPTIVICYDSMYKPAQPGGAAPSRAQLLETAREWVRYANITRGYNVEYWEIGNETWQPHYNGSATAANYARDLIEFAGVMKSVDPTIRIGANGASTDWWRTILSSAASAIDFLAVHNYPAYEWGSYARYRDNSLPLMDAVTTARSAIEAYAPAADRDRLEVAVTETGPADWSALWPHRNDAGHALVLFDMLGRHLIEPDVAFTQLWNTRWSGNDTATVPSVFDAFDRENSLQATGRAVAIWGQFLKKTMVASTSTGKVRTYSTYSSADRRLTIFLINKDTAVRETAIRIDNLPGSLSGKRWVFKGSDPGDLYPTWSSAGQVAAEGNRITATLDPVSVTVLDITAAGYAFRAVPGTVEAEDFDAFWDATPANYGGQYRSTPVDIELTSDTGGGYNVGWIDAGEWLEYAIGVQSSGTYQLSARVASPHAGGTLRMTIDGASVGVLEVPNTGSWQSWRTVPLPAVFIDAGQHQLRVATDTGGFNLNKIVIEAANAAGRPVPATIEAEDFDAFWDSTPENSGGQYRSTPVDIERTSDTGGGYNVGWFHSGEWLEYVIEVQSSGNYQLSARVASPWAGRILRMTIDGASGGALEVPQTGSWQSWQTIRSSGVFLGAGTHRVRVSTDTGGFNLNRITIEAAGAAGRAVPGTIEAEDFDTFWDSTPENHGGQYRSTAVDIERTSDTGGGYNVGWFAAGEWLEYVIQVQTPGTYEITARVASPHSGAILRVTIDGATLANLDVPNTGSWQSWRTLRTSGFLLTAGTHRVRVFTSTGGLNLNRIAFVNPEP